MGEEHKDENAEDQDFDATVELFSEFYEGSLAPEKAAEYFDRLAAACRAALDTVETGRFGANMQVSLTNDGPVTFWLDTG